MVKKYPKAVVFDLDYTLWPLWCDTHISSPIKSKDPYTIIDSYKQEFSFYRDVPKILKELREEGVMICSASRTCDPKMAQKMLKLLHVDDIDGDQVSAIDLFTHMEWGTGSKKKHLTRISEKLGVEFSQMCLYDDEWRNSEVEDLGVKFIHLRNESVGLSYQLFEKGLESWYQFEGREKE